MDLTLTKEQRKYLDKRGPMKATTLQRIYKQSVQEQQKTLKQAEQIRAQQRKSK